jgi:hypothetical protein
MRFETRSACVEGKDGEPKFHELEPDCRLRQLEAIGAVA